MQIAFFGVDDQYRKSIEGAFKDSETIFIPEKISPSNVERAKDADILCVFVSAAIDKAIIDALPRLRLIATRSTGTDHIDCAYAASKGIAVSNVPGYGSVTVAEFTFGLLLGITRNIIAANEHAKKTLGFSQTLAMQGIDLRGKMLGVIGTGKIGKNVVRIARAFGMEVVAYDPHPDPVFAKEAGFAYADFDEVMHRSDIITLHCPYTRDNHRLIDRDAIRRMKRGVYIVNTARGELIDSEALMWGLTEGIIAAAGLDVLEQEKNINGENAIAELNRKLFLMPNVIITPHIAFDSREAVSEIFRVTIDNIRSFIAGTLKNLV